MSLLARNAVSTRAKTVPHGVEHHTAENMPYEQAILAELVREARKALEPLAKLELTASYGKIASTIKGLGAETGTGIHIRVANVHLDSKGSASVEEVQRFENECDSIRDQYFNQVSVYMVSTALLMTVLVVMAVAEAQHLLDEPTLDTEDAPSMWGPDAASWIAPGNELGIRRAFYAAEFAILATCLMLSVAGVFLCNCQCGIIMGMPSHVAMIEYLLHGGLQTVPTLYICVDLPFFLFPFALPFVAARFSTVAFVGCLILAIGCHLIWLPFFTCGPMHLYNRVLQKRARAAVARTAQERHEVEERRETET
jgi:hypothetical protein